MEAVEPIDDAVSRFVGLVGGLFGIGTAIAASYLWVYRRGVQAGREVEQQKKQARDLAKIKANLKGK